MHCREFISFAAVLVLTACGADQPAVQSVSSESASSMPSSPPTQTPTSAAVAVTPQEAPVVFNSIPYFGTPVSQLYLGEPVYRDEYPTTFHTMSDGSLCTSTLVGPRVLITAAHCVEKSLSIRLDVQDGAATDKYYGFCSTHPDYPGDKSADVALCLMADAVPVTAFENLETELAWAKVGGKIRLVGFGCITADMKKGNDGVLRQGETSITSLPTTASNYVTTSGGVALCPGDSGGPAFRPIDGSYDQRRIISVNSSVQAFKVAEGEYVIDVDALSSSVSLFAAPKIKAFLKTWADGNGNPPMCGISPDAPDCRQ